MTHSLRNSSSGGSLHPHTLGELPPLVHPHNNNGVLGDSLFRLDLGIVLGIVFGIALGVVPGVWESNSGMPETCSGSL